jgi:hypothetical protein
MAAASKVRRNGIFAICMSEWQNRAAAIVSQIAKFLLPLRKYF